MWWKLKRIFRTASENPWGFLEEYGRDPDVVQLIEDRYFCIGGVEEKESLEAEIISSGKRAVRPLIEEYLSGKRERWQCFSLIFRMEPTVYRPVLDVITTDSEGAKDILGSFANSKSPVPELLECFPELLQDQQKAPLTLSVIRQQYPIIVAANPEQIPCFHSLGPAIEPFLHHKKYGVASCAAQCLALINPPDMDVAGLLSTRLKELSPRDDFHTYHDFMRALGVLGGEAKASLTVLADIVLCENANVGENAITNLVRIGGAEHNTIQLLLQTKQRLEKSSILNRDYLLKKLDKAMNPLMKQLESPKKGIEIDPRLAALIKGLDNSPPWGGPNPAREELKRLRDPELLEKIRHGFMQKLSAAEFYRLATILGHLTKNTKSQEGGDLLIELLQRKRLRKSDVEGLIHAAAVCELKEAFFILREILWKEPKKYFLSMLSYYEAVKMEEAVEDLEKVVEEAPGDWTLCIHALRKMGGLRAIPVLLRLAERELTSKRKEEWMTRMYAISALGKLKANDAVPKLIELLKQPSHKGSVYNICEALNHIGNERAYGALLDQAKKFREFPPRKERVIYTSRTPLENALEFFGKTKRLSDPEVQALIDEVRQPENWSLFLPREQEFIDYVVRKYSE